MTRLLDLGISRISNIIMDMANLSDRSVSSAIESYEKGIGSKQQIFEWSEQLRILQDEVAELAIELIARYQPVASDLRFIRSCMEISYGFSRFGRYAYDIMDTITTMGSISHCDKTPVLEVAGTANEMIHMSVESLQKRDKDAAKKLYEMDDIVDTLYRKYLREVFAPTNKKDMNEMLKDPRCNLSTLLILRYLERIADHACYIGDSVYYITTGVSSPRR
ncbi:MAG TPA: phosphate uptake regulator PhoU [Nitrososphaera sp.]